MTGAATMRPGSIVVLYLVNPNEKYWGILSSVAEPGVILRGINLSSFDDWVRAITHDVEEPSLGLTTIFFPLHRVERIFLDEPVGQVESLCQSFERRVGATVEEYLELGSSGLAN